MRPDAVVGLQTLGESMGVPLGEIVVTVGIVLGVVGVRYVARRWNATHDGHRGAKVALSGGAAVVTVLGVLGVLTIWNLLVPLQVSYSELGVEDIAGNLLLAAVVLAAAYALSSFVGRVIEEVTSATGRVSEHQREIIYRLSQVVLYSIALLVAIGLFTQNLGSLLVGAGFMGIVVGMAARQTLGAVLAGFVLMFSRPFEIGDWVEIGDREGIVTHVSVVNTSIQTFDGEYVLLPNDEVSSQAIVNRTRKGRLRVEVEVGVDYEDDPSRAADVALAAVKDLEEVMTVPTPQVVGKRFADSSVVLGVRFWIDNPSARRRWRAQTAVISAVKAAFTEAGIKIPFPQRELMARTEEGGFRLSDGSRELADGRDATGTGREEGRPDAGEADAEATTTDGGDRDE